MTNDKKPRRRVLPGRVVILGTGAAAAAAVAFGTGASAETGSEADGLQLAQASEGAAGGEGEGEGAPVAGEGAAAGSGGEGEGEGASAGSGGEGEGEGEGGGDAIDPEVALLRDLGFMTGHLRAGLALHEQGDLEAARTHIGHPIQEKYEAVAGTLDARGFSGLRDQMTALIEAAEGGADHAQVQQSFDDIIATVDEIRADSSATPAMRLMALAELGAIAAEEYDIAIADDGSVDNLHEYQDSWGFLRTIESQAQELAEGGDAGVTSAAEEIAAQVEAAGEAYGDLQGENISNADPSILYGAAARMELAALGAGS